MEIVVRAALMFLFLWSVTRVVGRSTLGELSSFQLILFITMGDLVGQAIVQQDYSFTAGALAVGTFALLTILIGWINSRWRGWARITHGVPVVVVQDGELLLETMRRERLGLNDLLAASRGRGIERVGDIRVAVLEANGQLSFFTSDPGASGASEQPPVG
ncbi:MAG: DUF421 domain-containing protein [Ornithinimicrobium sp.]|uniref:DUF421 domain-containing protein n=1 Tax=Ornithinimicrobium sp. TaxID=1977084 RepID=UPI0026E0F303|nr:YetF domain-containing protein [Ornithinimicrobium sp.]MDO5739470.1 DUF421 domain-containing protein [Ornithinimicrobium sp.]